jgi:3-oxoadipate enol-lactonase
LNQPLLYARIIDTRKSDNPWIVMVHGFSHNHTYFDRQIKEFQKDHRLFAVDLRGHGQSSAIPGPYGVEEYADDILAALDAAGITRAIYWGTHTGSAIGLIIALRQPERFSHLILEGTFLPGFPMPKVGELLNRASGIARDKGLQAALDDWFEHAGWFDHINQFPEVCRAEEHRTMINQFEGAPWLTDLKPRAVTPTAENLAMIGQPVLIYNGMDDLDDFKNAAQYLADELPHGRRYVIPDAGGFPAWENPSVVNHLVGDFLAEVTLERPVIYQ